MIYQMNFAYMIMILYREWSACLGMLAKSSGTGFRAGMRVPTDEHGLL
jgi:hypothetical protein